MTATIPASTNGHGPKHAAQAKRQPAEDPRQAATDAYWASIAAGSPATGTELGERYGRSGRWGRQVIADARQAYEELSGADDGSEAATPSKADLAGRIVLVIAMVGVISAAAVISFDHHRVVALAAGEGWRAWFLPVSIDGMIIVASITAWQRKKAGQEIGSWVWISLTLGILATMAGNIRAAEGTLESRVIAAWPPLALKLCLGMLLVKVKHRPQSAHD